MGLGLEGAAHFGVVHHRLAHEGRDLELFLGEHLEVGRAAVGAEGKSGGYAESLNMSLGRFRRKGSLVVDGALVLAVVPIAWMW